MRKFSVFSLACSRKDDARKRCCCGVRSNRKGEVVFEADLDFKIPFLKKKQPVEESFKALVVGLTSWGCSGQICQS